MCLERDLEAVSLQWTGHPIVMDSGSPETSSQGKDLIENLLPFSKILMHIRNRIYVRPSEIWFAWQQRETICAGARQRRKPRTRWGSRNFRCRGLTIEPVPAPDSSFARSASFCENQSACVRSATQQTCHFECFVTFRSRRHSPRNVQGVGRPCIPIKPVRWMLRLFAHRSADLPAVCPRLISPREWTPV